MTCVVTWTTHSEGPCSWLNVLSSVSRNSECFVFAVCTGAWTLAGPSSSPPRVGVRIAKGSLFPKALPTDSFTREDPRPLAPASSHSENPQVSQSGLSSCLVPGDAVLSEGQCQPIAWKAQSHSCADVSEEGAFSPSTPLHQFCSSSQH